MAEVTIASLEPRQKLWVEKACAAFERGNFAYVVDATTEVLRAAPGCLPVRRLQRIARRRDGAEPGGMFLRRWLKWIPLAGARPGGEPADPVSGLRAAEKWLAWDPDDTFALGLLADAAGRMDLPETRVFALEAIRELEPDNRANLLALGDALIAVARNAEALELAEAMLAARRGDPEAQELARAASVALTVAQPGWNGPAEVDRALRARSCKPE